ncbi:MAG: GH25 family lysozyme [Faecousia sp.]
MKQRKIHIRAWAAVLGLALLLAIFSGCGGPSRVTKETEETTFGIDVARYQGTIDWQTLAQSGIDFAMVRLGYRTMSDGMIEEDSNGRYNLQEGSKAGIPLGVYFFSSAITEEEAVEEANWVAGIIAQYPITYPVVYDCEGFLSEKSRQYGMTREARTDVALAFLKTIEKLGYEGMFYSSKHELENEWEMDRIEKNYKVWVAQYPQTPYPGTAQSSYTGAHHMWQYSKEGTVDGITQPVDLNVAYFGYDGIEPARNPTPPEEVEPDVEALMNFTQVNEEVTAKVETNLRDRPNQDPDSQILYTLQNGEVAQRIAVSANGWSKLIYEGNIYYAVTNYLTTDLHYDPGAVAEPEDDGIQTQFTQVNYPVTAKKVVNLRKLPSVEHEDAEVLAQLQNGDIATCVGISDNGWSKLIYNGITCYAVTSYLVQTDGSTAQTQPEDDGIKTQFEEMNDRVTAKVEVNLRSLPSVEDPDCIVVVTLKNGEVITRTGINRDLGWSRVDYNGQTLYCVSSYLTEAK